MEAAVVEDEDMMDAIEVRDQSDQNFNLTFVPKLVTLLWIKVTPDMINMNHDDIAVSEDEEEEEAEIIDDADLEDDDVELDAETEAALR